MKRKIGEFTFTVQWDGYLTCTPAVARKISSTGKLPREGYEVKCLIKWPAQVCTVQGTREKVSCPESEMWLGWTTYNGTRMLYVH